MSQPWSFPPTAPPAGPRVAVVMAAKNYAKFLPAAVESVLAQTVTDWELVIVDDGSSDDTPEVVKPFLADARVKCVRSDRLGQPRAKNLGVRLTAAPLVAFLDADDAWLPAKLEKQLPLFRDPRVGVGYCHRTLIDESGAPLPVQPPQAIPAGPTLPAVFARNFVCFSSVVMRREVFELSGGFDPELDLAIDYDLWLRVAAHAEFAGVAEKLVLYRTGHANLSKRLADRVLTADSIMTRALDRRDLRGRLLKSLVGEGYASTYRALAYTLSRGEPWAGLRWYARAAARPGSRRLAALKGVAGCVARGLRGGHAAVTGENAGAKPVIGRLSKARFRGDLRVGLRCPTRFGRRPGASPRA